MARTAVSDARPTAGFRIRRSERLSAALGSAAILAGLIGAWELAMVIAKPPTYLLPYPHEIAAAWFENLGHYLKLGWNTGRIAVIGGVIGSAIAIVVGSLVAQVRWIADPIVSYAAMLQATPLVVLAPVTQVWFGQGAVATAVVVAIAVFPPTLIATVRGLQSSPRLVERLMVSYAASPIHVYWKVRLPAATPFIMSGLKVAAPTALIVAIVAELFGGPVDTIGTFMRQEALRYQTVEVWAAAFTAVVTGLLIYAAVAGIERALLHGRRNTENR